ncbi:response regulator transcription factor [Actinomycetospora lutea]|uniref:response regulator transcription factor n=1 Tax=Actinomycetospora lutea TaxID=663604 RepID=UPI003B682397
MRPQLSDLSSWNCCRESRLSPRETEVLSLLSQGKSAYQAASLLLISRRTIEKHVEHIYRKLEVGDKVGAINRGRELGLI